MIKELVFNAGGAKGVGMPGVYYALKNTSIWPNIETIAGSSVGAITATLFAVSNVRVFYETIKEDVERDLTSLRAFALTRAVELCTKQKQPREILAEIHQKNQELHSHQHVFFSKQRNKTQSASSSEVVCGII